MVTQKLKQITTVKKRASKEKDPLPFSKEWIKQDVQRKVAQQEREIKQFYVFPKWFPKSIALGYERLLRALIYHFDVRFPNFDTDALRRWVDMAVSMLKRPNNSRAMEILQLSETVSVLEYTIIFELALYERAANFPAPVGLELLSGEFARKGYISGIAYKYRGDVRDKLDFQRLFMQHRNDIRSLSDLSKFPQLEAYRRKYKDPQTLRNWMNEVAPGHLRRGAPAKK